MNSKEAVSIGPRLFRHGNSANRSARRSVLLPGFQLGHVFSDMEIPSLLEQERCTETTGVSIGPRLFRHGNAQNLCPFLSMGVGVSIGPRLFRHGNLIAGWLATQAVKYGFQLGHVFSDMEILEA